jgi:D-amino-acid dehydrogenase
LEASGDRIERVITNRGELTADAYVLCLGSWSPLLVKRLGVPLSVYPVKGYSVTIPVEDDHTPPAVGGIDEERKLAYSPLGNQVRLTTVAEFTGYDTTHTPQDFEYLLAKASDLLPNAGNYDKAEQWAGLRPMTPDSLPVLGTARHRNLYFNTGHGHMGWTMACGTARLTADLVAKRTPEIPLDHLKLR